MSMPHFAKRATSPCSSLITTAATVSRIHAMRASSARIAFGSPRPSRSRSSAAIFSSQCRRINSCIRAHVTLSMQTSIAFPACQEAE